MSAVETEFIRLDNVLGVDVRPGLVDIRGRIIRDGVVECEAAGVVQRGHVEFPRRFGREAHADCYWYESAMERFERAHPPTLPH